VNATVATQADKAPATAVKVDTTKKAKVNATEAIKVNETKISNVSTSASVNKTANATVATPKKWICEMEKHIIEDGERNPY